MNDVIPIKAINNRNLQVIIDFLTEIIKDGVESLPVGGGVVVSTPERILHPHVDIRKMQGFIMGFCISKIQHIIDDLININKDSIDMNSLGGVIFKDFNEELNSGKPYITLSLLFLSETITMNFVQLAGYESMTLINFWVNEVNVFQQAMEKFMEREKVTSDELFGTTSNTLPEVKALNVLDLVKVINDENGKYSIDQLNEAITTYTNMVNSCIVNDEHQEFPMQVISDIGLLANGCDLPVNLQCQSHHHVDNGSYKVLPYSLKGDPCNMLLCWDCSCKEREDILEEHPEWAVD